MANAIALDCPVTAAGVYSGSFWNMDRLAPYDTVIWDLEGTFSYIAARSGGFKAESLPLVQSGDTLDLFRDRFASRVGDFTIILENGGTIFVFLTAHDTVAVATGHSTYTKVRLLDALGSGVPKLHAGEGTRFHICGDELFRSALKPVLPCLRYFASLPPSSGDPFLQIPVSKDVVGTVFQRLLGNVVLMPRPHPIETVAVMQEVFGALVQLSDKLRDRGSASSIPLPAWIGEYRLPEELQLDNDLNALRSQLADVQLRIAEASDDLALWHKWKRLLYAHGDVLLDVANEAFSLLGFTVLEQPVSNEADVVMEADGITFVAEVKGVVSSAKLRDARELDNWAGQYAFQHDLEIDPKQVMVINAYRDEPLTKRTETVFPDNMLAWAKIRKQCLMTSTQLLDMVVAVLREPDLAPQFRGQIADTVGIMPGHDDLSVLFAAANQEQAGETAGGGTVLDGQ